MISRDEILMGREVEYPLTKELEANLSYLLTCLNQFRTIYGIPMHVNSGYRPGRYNVAAKGANNSSHLSCEACDFADSDGAIRDYIGNHPDILEKCNLYMESPSHTPGWVHLQTRPTRARIFIP